MTFFEVSERIHLMRLQLPAMPYKMAAFLFSVVGSCKRLGLDTYAYLRDVLGQLRTPPAARLAEISPDAWFAVHPRARRKIAS